MNSGKTERTGAALAQAQRKELADGFDAFRKQIDEQGKAQSDGLRDRFGDLLKQLDEQSKKNLDSVKDVRGTVEKQLKEMRDDNGKRLDEMRKTVDEKLQVTLEKRLGESFKQVSDRLEQVHKGLGEMQTLASGVGDLKKVLTNVKTKGILGEYQLGQHLGTVADPGAIRGKHRHTAGQRRNGWNLPCACRAKTTTRQCGCP